jgi:hypothetical protein
MKMTNKKTKHKNHLHQTIASLVECIELNDKTHLSITHQDILHFFLVQICVINGYSAKGSSELISAAYEVHKRKGKSTLN